MSSHISSHVAFKKWTKNFFAIVNLWSLHHCTCIATDFANSVFLQARKISFRIEKVDNFLQSLSLRLYLSHTNINDHIFLCVFNHCASWKYIMLLNFWIFFHALRTMKEIWSLQMSLLSFPYFRSDWCPLFLSTEIVLLCSQWHSFIGVFIFSFLKTKKKIDLFYSSVYCFEGVQWKCWNLKFRLHYILANALVDVFFQSFHALWNLLPGFFLQTLYCYLWGLCSQNDPYADFAALFRLIHSSQRK